MEVMAVTYRTGTRARDMRTVLLTDARRSVVLLPGQARMEILQGQHEHGRACACRFWAEELGLDVSDRTFAIPAEAVAQARVLGNVKTRKAWH